MVYVVVMLQTVLMALPGYSELQQYVKEEIILKAFTM